MVCRRLRRVILESFSNEDLHAKFDVKADNLSHLSQVMNESPPRVVTPETMNLNLESVS